MNEPINDSQKNGMFIWIVKNNKYNFEAIRKSAEFNGIALKITNSEIKLIIAKNLGIMVQKPYFDLNSDYTRQVEEKIMASNQKEELMKITSIKNFILIEKFNTIEDTWEIIYFDKLIFHTVENFGINIELISSLRNEKKFSDKPVRK